MKVRWMYTVLFVWSLAYSLANAEPNRSVSRGELLYTTHCVACHTAKLHWRDEKLAKDWMSLGSQVNRWQKNAGLKWSNDDVVEVARYLNASHYHFTEPAE